MNIRYAEAVTRGWERMKDALFDPFDVGKWCVLGFAAFLATLPEALNRSDKNPFKWAGTEDAAHHFGMFFQNFGNWISENPFGIVLISFGAIILFAIGIVFTWLSSRGKFIFLDNVVHNRALIKKPWDKYSSLSNSLFIWRLCFGFIAFAVFGLLFIVAAFNIYSANSSGDAGFGTAFSLFVSGLAGFGLAVITGYISLFLNHFIVPIMYKNNISAIKAWRRFIPLLSSHLPGFVIYGLMIFVLHIVTFFAVLLIALLTCCIGFLLLGIPYISSVVLLPVTYTFRALSLEFLEQFGPEYEFFQAKYDDIDFI